ncbi:VOC family protein [Streptomyces sp. NPDC101455]|uniref:VOC family protein n=1 Tax=Streptomyces sp. NPDC101455 TaxID=3366142 RepID=UPI00380FEB44
MTIESIGTAVTFTNGLQKDFGLTGIEHVLFAVEDIATAAAYAGDWGLTRLPGDGVVFASADGCQVEFVETDLADPRRTPVGGSSGLVQVTWGTKDASFIPAIAAELGEDRQAVTDDAGVLHSKDDLGFLIAFRPTTRSLPAYDPTRYNAPGFPERIDRRAVKYDRAEPREISHLAIGVDDAAEAARFYVERLGFRISDRYANRGLFLRCSPAGNHHNLFLMNAAKPGTRFNHLSFKVRDIHETVLGGQAFETKGWTTFAGPGRHEVSSACFWYFLTPFGGSFEYAADEDMVTEEWVAEDFAATAHIFSQWTFGLEKSDGTLKGPISNSKEGNA